ncbi:MAG: hypothetical protein VB118_10715 [Oscillospiraceae bacterium]|nr:hypothetical protein [Oscillospiraceae bacterium]
MKKLIAIILALTLAVAIAIPSAVLAEEVKANAGGTILQCGMYRTRSGFFRIEMPSAPSSWNYSVKFDFKYSSVATPNDLVVYSSYDGTAYEGGRINLKGDKLNFDLVAEGKVEADNLALTADAWHSFELIYTEGPKVSLKVDGAAVTFGGNAQLTPSSTTLSKYIGFIGDLSNQGTNDQPGTAPCLAGAGYYDGFGFWDNFVLTEGSTEKYSIDFESEDANKAVTLYPVDRTIVNTSGYVTEEGDHATVVNNAKPEGQNGHVRINIATQPKGDDWSLGFDFRIPSYVPDAGLEAGLSGYWMYQAYNGTTAYEGPRFCIKGYQLYYLDGGTEVGAFENFTFVMGTWNHFEIKYMSGNKFSLIADGTPLTINGESEFTASTAPRKDVIGFIGDTSGSTHDGSGQYDNFVVTENGAIVWQNNFSYDALRTVGTAGLLSQYTNTEFINIGGDEENLAPATEEPSDDGDDTETPVKTGDNGIIFALVALVSAAGAITVAKKRK